MKQNDLQEMLEKRLIAFKEEIQFLPSRNEKKKWQYFDISDNLYPPIKHSFLQYAYDNAVPFHDYVNHVRSSQIFGINLLFPLLSDKEGRNAFCEIIGQKISKEITEIESFQFEYSPDEDLLGEWPGKIKPSEYVTSVDLLVNFKSSHSVIGILFEIKFTEKEFGPCNGNTSNGCSSEDRKYCENFNDVLEDYTKCYLHKKYKTRSARKYFNYFDLKNEMELKNNRCPFIDNNQCIRNHALARAMRKNMDYSETYFGLIYYDGNNDIERDWEAYFNVMKNSEELLSIKASDIVKKYGILNRTYKMYWDKRYGI
jgi:hypothetical protein